MRWHSFLPLVFFVAVFVLSLSCSGDNTSGGHNDSSLEDISRDDDVPAMSESDFAVFMREQVNRLIASVRKGDAAGFASLCRFPIERKYPLHDIVDSADMVARYGEIFDDEIRNAIRATDADDWGGINWRGYTFGEGDYVWLDEEVYRIPYHSRAEERERERLVKEDLASIGTGFAKGWIPEICLLDTLSDTVYRVDIEKLDPETELDCDSTKCRLMLYGKGESLSGKPSHVLNGHKELQGSAGTRCYIFHLDDGLDWTICNYWFEYEIKLYVTERDNILNSIGLQKVYWLDLIKERE